MLYRNEEQLLYKAKQAEGKKFGDIDKNGRLVNKKSKGNLVHVIEESFFGYKINSDKEADFENLGIELKVTPIKKNKNHTLSAKERLVLNIINYHDEVKCEFKTSSFWNKNQKLLLMFYLWQPKISRSNYKLIKAYLHSYSEEDLAIIEKDWNFIVNKIKQGKAHELSEGDTNYLGACPKGASKKSLRTQPFSNELAMQRAFSLKQSYMTTLVRKVINNEELTRFTSKEELKKKTLYDLLLERFNPYIGMT